MRSSTRLALTVVAIVSALLLARPGFLSVQAGAAQAGTYWGCPMDPEVESMRPGTCPKCGMALVKMNADGTRATATPRKSPEPKKPAPKKPAAVPAAAPKASAKPPAAAPAKPAGVTLALHTDPSPLQVGRTEFMVMAKDASHELIGDATVTLVLTLPADTPGGAVTRIDVPMTAAEQGIYRGSARVPKKGSWTFTVEAKRGPQRLGSITQTLVAQ